MKKIRIDTTKPWGVVPEAMIEDGRLGHRAALLAVWLTIRPDGWKVWKEYAKMKCRLGEDGWDTACRQLEEAGYLLTKKSRTAGRFSGLQIEFNPQPDGRPTVGGFTAHDATDHGSAGDAEPAHLTRTLIPITLKHKKPPTPAGAGANQVVVREGQEARRPFDQDDLSGLHWPTGLSPAWKKAMSMEIVRIDITRRQELLDEVAGRMTSSIPVGNPPGLTRKLVNLELSGLLTCELAEGVRATREAHCEHQKRLDKLSAGDGGLGYRKEDRAPKVSKPASAVALAARAELRAARHPGGKWA